MRTLRHTRRRPRSCQRVVVVAARRSDDMPTTEHEIDGYESGLRAIGLLNRHFPEFFAEHAARRPVATTLLFGAACAFWRLMEERGLQLIWPHEYGYSALQQQCPKAPIEALCCWMWVDFGTMAESVEYFIREPRLEYWGLGVELLLDWDINAFKPGPLLYALWHLFSQTSWSLGIDDLDRLDLDSIDQATMRLIRRLPPLPASTIVARLWPRVTIPEAAGVSVQGLVGFAFGKTGNDLADHSSHEIDEIYAGDYGNWDWGDWKMVVQLQQQARLIQAAFQAWEARIMANPRREILALAEMLHQAAEPCATEPGSALIDLLSLVEDGPESVAEPSSDAASAVVDVEQWPLDVPPPARYRRREDEDDTETEV